MDEGSGVVLRRLKSCNSFSSLMDKQHKSFSDQLALEPEENRSALFKFLIEEEASLALEYNALRALLKEALLKPGTLKEEVLKSLVNEAIDLCNILIKKYDLYINEHTSFLTKQTLQNHAESYRRWLESAPPLEVNSVPKLWSTYLWELMCREFSTERMNPRRLYVLRERRLVLLLVPLVRDLGDFSSWIIWADGYVGPFLAYLNCLFFLPRLAFNLYTLCNNVFDENKAESKHLGVFTRFVAQWNRLWPQLMNDIGWATNGMLMCFLFVGSLQPFAIYLSVAMQFYDVIMASIRVYIDLNRFNTLMKQYIQLGETSPDNDTFKLLLPLYLEQLENGMQREKTLLYLALANASVLFLAICLSLPFMVAISPIFPIVGAVIAIIMTVINFQGRSYLNTPESATLESLLEKHRPIAASKRSHSIGNSTPFFSPGIRRSQSNTEISRLPMAPSPTGIMHFHSVDDLDAYMLGGHKI